MNPDKPCPVLKLMKYVVEVKKMTLDLYKLRKKANKLKSKHKKPGEFWIGEVADAEADLFNCFDQLSGSLIDAS